MEHQQSLQPVVIPPLQATIRSQKFLCSGNGLLKDGQKYDSQVDKYLPLLEPVRTKAGKVAARQPKIPAQSAYYWKAQCAFRKLSQSGAIAELQARLRNTDAGMDPELAKLEKELNAEFRAKNAAARDEKWNGLETDEQRANEDPERFLRERFLKGKDQQPGGTGDGVVVLKTRQRLQLHEEAEPLGLYSESTNAPLIADGERPDIDRWIVIGKDRAAVSEKIREISREAARSRQRAQEAEDERTRKLHEEIVKEAGKTGKTGSGNVWNVTGTWSIKCPYMEDSWGNGTDGCSLNIYSTESRGGRQMWADFDFIAITGVFRFESPTPTKGDGRQPGSSSALDAENDEDDDDEEGTEHSDDSRPTPPPVAFCLDPNDKPSPRCPRWNYRWRGEETGEGEIQLYSDKNLCSITFHGPSGTKLKGTFESDLTSKIDFTGIRTSSITRRPELGIDDAWNSRNERAHERARTGRWG